MDNKQTTIKAQQIRKWVEADTGTDDEEVIQALLNLLTDAVNNPNELDWIRESVEAN
jgi:hypothetical protein